MLTGLHHIQLAIPPGGEGTSRSFWCGLLQMTEVAKPERLRGRGGCWFRCGGLELHLGVEDPFHPQRKAHPAFLTADLAWLRERLEAAGVPLREGAPLPGLTRFFAEDPFGNRLEFLSPTD
ncbi:MAG: VOC family protein [Pseudomonadota bacterium]